MVSTQIKDDSWESLEDTEYCQILMKSVAVIMLGRNSQQVVQSVCVSWILISQKIAKHSALGIANQEVTGTSAEKEIWKFL